MLNLKIMAAIAMTVLVAGCSTVSQRLDSKTGILVTTVAVRGCGNPSQTLTWVQRPGHKEDAYASTGADLCGTAVGGAFGVAASAVLPRGGDTTFNNANASGSSSVSSSDQKTNVNVD